MLDPYLAYSCGYWLTATTLDEAQRDKLELICRKLGIKNVFRVNGPAGVAALGFGTETIPRVHKVMGPGSPAVTCAQVLMQSKGLATMMLLGPTESIVIADSSADAKRLAADLLIEAEHGIAIEFCAVNGKFAKLNTSCSSMIRPINIKPKRYHFSNFYISTSFESYKFLSQQLSTHQFVV